LSRTYVKLIRDRAWIYSNERSVPLSVLKLCLINVAKMLAPISPFISEEIYQRLEGNYEKSVFEAGWPLVDEKAIDKKLEEEFEYAKEFLEGALAAREKAKIKIRQPLREVYIPFDVGEAKVLIQSLANVKEVKVGAKEGLVEAETKFGKVYLNANLDQELIEEGLFRELVRAIQEERKKRKMNVWDKISLRICENELTLKMIEKFGERLMEEVGAESILIEEMERGIEIKAGKIGKIVFNF
jgi:isoleucyl-tRNA synthetase